MRDQNTSWLRRLLESGQFFLAIGVTLAVLAWLLFAPTAPEPPRPAKRVTLQDSVRVAGPRLITITSGTPVEKSLESVTTATTTIKNAFFTVPGRVVASTRPSAPHMADKKASEKKTSQKDDNGGKAIRRDDRDWQFDSPDLQTIYADWQKARADIVFAREQRTSIYELAAGRIDSQTKLVERLKKTVAAGTDAVKDLAAEENNLRQFKIQGRKEEHEADAAVHIAERNEASLSRQLQLAGLDPQLLMSADADTDIVMADVPENRLSQVKIGQGVEATFLGVPEKRFEGNVCCLVPVLTKDRHSLRVLFVVHDPMDRIRPGMFADIGLGTDERQSITIPGEALLHIDRGDFVLVHDTGDTWKVVEVKVGEPRGDQIEISWGLKPGDRVLTKGAILMKPAVILSMRQAVSDQNGTRGNGR